MARLIGITIGSKSSAFKTGLTYTASAPNGHRLILDLPDYDIALLDADAKVNGQLDSIHLGRSYIIEIRADCHTNVVKVTFTDTGDISTKMLHNSTCPYYGRNEVNLSVSKAIGEDEPPNLMIMATWLATRAVWPDHIKEEGIISSPPCPP